jgi:euchromatic histone-lysine N-methyltransferase
MRTFYLRLYQHILTDALAVSQVFRTPKKGWAVRSWDFIPSGAPVCEYTGILMRTEDTDSVSENNYIFDIDCLQTMRGLGGREVLLL